jgi:hypothetical protein
MTCPGFEQLLDYLDGRLDATLAQSAASHLTLGCAQCDEDREWYQQIRIVTATDDSLEPPAWVLKRALRVFNAPRFRTSIGARVGRVVASLVFDSSSRPALAGARSAGAEGRQLLYRAEQYSIDLHLAAFDNKCAEVTGQILCEGELMFESVAGVPLDLMCDGGTIFSTFTNGRGEFTIPPIDLGTYDLRVELKEASITIVGLAIA